MFLRKLIQNHFEKYGNFNAISSTSFYSSIIKTCKDSGEPITEFLYKALGYISTADISAEQRFRYRKMVAENKFEELAKIFRVGSKKDLIAMLESENCMADVHNVYQPQNMPKAIESICRLLSDYYRFNDDFRLQSDNAITLGEYINSLRILDSKKAVMDSLNDPMFQKIVSNCTPKFEVKANCNPLISKGTLYVPYQYSKAELNDLVSSALLQATMNVLDVPYQIHFKVVKVGLTYYSLAEMQPENYLNLIDYANSLQMTVKDLLKLCDINHIDFEKQFNDTGCYYVLTIDNSMLVYGRNSESSDDFLVCSKEVFKSLYTRDLLKTLTWKNQIPFVNTGVEIQVGELFGLKPDKFVGV